MNEQNAAIKPYVIGLDLGGTNSVFGIVDARGEIKATTAIKTGGYEKVEDYVDACVEALQVIIDQVGGIEKIKAMGIGAPNGNYYNGTIEFAPNLAWAVCTQSGLGEKRCSAFGKTVQRASEQYPCSPDKRRQCRRHRRDGLWCGTRYEELHCDHLRYRRRFWYCSEWSAALRTRRFCR